MAGTVYRHLLRPVLFRLDAERAHALAIRCGELGVGHVEIGSVPHRRRPATRCRGCSASRATAASSSTTDCRTTPRNPC
jgi:hypothetical protein